MQLDALKIIVTGAASGIGRAFALNLDQAGAQVMAADMDREGLDALADEASDRLATHVVDVANEDSVIGLIGATAEAFGAVNGLVNCAGIFRDALLVSQDRKTGEVKKMSLAAWQKVIDVDLTGPFLCTREVAAHMVEHGTKPGVIVNISSVSRHGNRGQTNYSAAKAGLVADTKLWGEELARHGIRVGAIAPGFCDTPILQGMRPEVLEKMLSKVPLRRAGSTHEMYLALKFILECDYFTARCIDVDGGVSM